MTIKDCIDIVDNMKPNQYTIREKVMWLSFVDETIINDVLKTHEGYDGRYDDFEGYTEGKLSVSLIVKSPYDRLYTAYLKMKIDQENGETARYNNSAALYNTYLMEFRKYYNKTHMPIEATTQRPAIPQKHTVGLSDAEYENIKRDLTHILTEHFSSTISHDKVYAVVNEFVQNNIHLLRVSPEEIKSSLSEYLKKNPIKIDVPDWALKPEKPTYTAGEVGTYRDNQIDKFLASKADKSDTLAGYGILDAFTKLEVGILHQDLASRITDVDKMVRKKADQATTLDGYGITDAYTKTEVDEALSKKTEETILYEDVVNTPEWTNQPTYEGEFDANFTTDDFYYVTLNDAEGNALPNGQFMLKDTRETDATVYATVFSLANLATGTDTLVENFPVEFTEIGKMRDAGVWRAQYTMTDWFLKGSTGSVKITTVGEFIQRNNGAMFTPVFITNNYVSCCHSAHKTASQSDSTKQIIPYAQLSGRNYKVNRFYDESILQRNGDETCTFKRKGFMRYISEGETGYTVTDYDTVGFCDILTDTKLSSVSFQVSGNSNYGFIRNGTIIRVSEVK